MTGGVGLNCLFVKRLWLVMKTMSRPWTPAFLILLITLPASFVEQVTPEHNNTKTVYFVTVY